MRKEEKNKVGRPKLADSKMKKESLWVCLFVFVIMMIVSVIGFKILTIDFNPRYVVGTIYNDHVNSCVIRNNKIDCGPNVTYMKYEIDDNKYVELTKQDESIKVDLDNSNDVKVCYKTDKTNLKCNK